MGTDRRTFLRVTSLAALGIGFSGKSRIALGTSGAPSSRAETRWAMVVDTAKCKKEDGCRDCIAVCHQVHNVPDIPNRRNEVKWIWKEPYDHVFPDQVNPYSDPSLLTTPVMVLCNHCDNPPCVRVCPTQATFKRDDGIVMMDQHRCIGCRYCIVGCPYGARSFNWTDPRPHIKNLNPKYPTRMKGVVEKCNFCAERLAVGEQPACVEACKAGALSFGNINDPNSHVHELLRTHNTIRRKPALGTNPEVHYIVRPGAESTPGDAPQEVEVTADA